MHPIKLFNLLLSKLELYPKYKDYLKQIVNKGCKVKDEVKKKDKKINNIR